MINLDPGILIGIAGAACAVGTWLYARGQKEGKDEMRLANATADLEASSVRISNIPAIESAVLSLTSTVKRNHDETRERLANQDAQLAKLVSQHSQLKADIASLEGRKVSVRELRVPTGTDWSAEAREAEKKR
jgi:hypothetical protein